MSLSNAREDELVPAESARLKKKLSEVKLLTKGAPHALLLGTAQRDGLDDPRVWEKGAERPMLESSSVKRVAQRPQKPLKPTKPSRDRDAAASDSPPVRAADKVRESLLKLLRHLTNVSEDLEALSSASVDTAASPVSGSEVHTCGQNSYGELAHCDIEPRKSFSRVRFLEGKSVVAIGAGNEHTVFVTSAGAVLAAGYNDNGQCGVGSTSQVRQPATLEYIAQENVSQVHVSNGCEHSLLITAEGKMFAFGYNYRGQVSRPV